MSFRTVIISTHCKLEYSLNYLVYRTVDEIKRINLDEIHTLIIESTAVSLTTALLLELINKKIKVIFCDEKRNPISELVSYYGDSVSPRKIQEQLSWTQDTKDSIWSLIVKEKIVNQANVVKRIDEKVYYELIDYSKQIEKGDITNREGHSAKIYFNNVFGKEFTRNGANEKNSYLNYGYSLLLSQFNKAIVSKGYLTQIGIHHKNEYNHFNFACDLMEPFRPIIDCVALSIQPEDNFKEILINTLNITVLIDNQRQVLVNAISIYCASVFKALSTGSLSEIKFFQSYEI